MLRMKRRRLIVEVVGCPGVDGRRPSDEHQDGCLFARRCSMPSWSATKSRPPKRKAWDGLKTGGTRILIGGSAGNSSEPKRVVSLDLGMVKVVEKWAIR